MVSDPYDAEDDAPTLQRTPGCPPKRAAPKPISGVRSAFVVPRDVPGGGFGADLEGIFNDEPTTDIDRTPVHPADLERETPALPIELATVLRLASAKSEPPPSGATSDSHRVVVEIAQIPTIATEDDLIEGWVEDADAEADVPGPQSSP